MTEAAFIRQNKDKWLEYESFIDAASYQSPDDLAKVYIDLTSDLAFAQTHFPNSRITEYINCITLQLHTAIYHSKPEKWTRFITFFTQEVPDAMFKMRKTMVASLIIFTIGVLIGWISTLGDDSFARTTLGEGYYYMTIDNINSGHPLAVYANGSEISSAIEIILNNIRVTFFIFVLGVLTSFVSGIDLLRNALIVGVLNALMFQYGYLDVSLETTMLHGTLELSTIVICGGASIFMGNGWLFPGTYSRLESFKKNAKKSLKVILSLVPVLIVAGTIEGFVTRHEEMPVALKLTIIGLSAAFIAYYYIYLPYKRNHHEKAKP